FGNARAVSGEHDLSAHGAGDVYGVIVEILSDKTLTNPVADFGADGVDDETNSRRLLMARRICSDGCGCKGRKEDEVFHTGDTCCDPFSLGLPSATPRSTESRASGSSRL